MCLQTAGDYSPHFIDCDFHKIIFRIIPIIAPGRKAKQIRFSFVVY